MCKIWGQRKVEDPYWAVVLNSIPAASGYMTGKVLGMGFLRGFADKWDEITFGMVVHKDYGNLGLGTLILQIAYVKAKMLGLKSLRLHVDPKNECAVQLYFAQGYRYQGSREDGHWILRKVICE
jgi:ribosomal protein S18 acetylase RimI-like enzyme